MPEVGVAVLEESVPLRIASKIFPDTSVAPIGW
jgi:hypothetical protein